MKKRQLPSDKGAARPPFAPADHVHAPGKHHINVEDISKPAKNVDPREYESHVPERIVAKPRVRRGRG